MPFEAGLAIAWAQVAGRRHRWFLLEKESYRLQRTLSDLNGFEVFTHGGTGHGLLAALPNMFLRRESPVMSELLACTRDLHAAAAEIAQLSRLELLPPWRGAGEL